MNTKYKGEITSLWRWWVKWKCLWWFLDCNWSSQPESHLWVTVILLNDSSRVSAMDLEAYDVMVINIHDITCQLICQRGIYTYREVKDWIKKIVQCVQHEKPRISNLWISINVTSPGDKLSCGQRFGWDMSVDGSLLSAFSFSVYFQNIVRSKIKMFKLHFFFQNGPVDL